MSKLAIFDLDGTLINSIQDIANAVNYGLKKLNLPTHDTKSYYDFVGDGADTLCERALPENQLEKKDELYKIFAEYYTAHYLDETVVYNQIYEVLDTLSKNNVKLAVASNKPHNFTVKITKHFFKDIFSEIVGHSDIINPKPDPQIINTIIENFNQDFSSVFMIGDLNIDINTAQNANINSIACTWGFQSLELLKKENPSYIINNPVEILDIII